MKSLILAFVFTAVVFGQGSVNIVSDPPPGPVVSLFYYDASINLQYVCRAVQRGLSTVQQRASATLTSVVVLTNVGTVTTASPHGLYVGARVTISGATVDTDLNGVYIVATVPSNTTYTITTASVPDATYTEATLVVTTNNPLTTAPLWAIQILTYDGSNNLTGSYWANASTGYGLACASRTSY